MNRSWLALLLLSFASASACTTEQDLGNRPPNDGGSDVPPGDGNNPGTDGGGVRPPGPMRAFVTRATYTGDLRTAARRASGLEAGDALCELAAQGAHIGGHWAAWLSDIDMDAIDRVDNDDPWVSAPGPGEPAATVVFRDRAGIGTGPLGTLYDEYGTNGTTGSGYWTGSSETGRANGQDCSSWSNGTATGCGGNGSYENRNLLCLEQKTASYRKRVFVTSKLFPANFSSASATPNATADGYCYDAAKAANLGGTWRAWLSAYDRGSSSISYRAPDRLGSRTSAWTLVDGTTVVFSSRDELLTVPEHAIDHDEFNHAVASNSSVWTGTTAKGDYSNNACDDFNAVYTDLTATAGVIGGTEVGAWTAGQSLACNATAHIYCFEQ